MSYQHLLVAVDTTEDRAALIAKARALSQRFGARLSVLSVMLPMPVGAIAGDAGMGLPMLAPLEVEAGWLKELRDEMRQGLTAACTPLGIPDSDIHLVTDHIDSGILETARRLQVDLIVVGHHQRSGWFSKLFAHTDQTIVGKTVCDVLVIAL